MNTIDSMERLVYFFSKLPGVGKKTAERYAYRIIDLNLEDVELFAKSIVDAKKNIRYCKVCGNFTEQEVCSICSSRQSKIICIMFCMVLLVLWGIEDLTI